MSEALHGIIGEATESAGIAASRSAQECRPILVVMRAVQGWFGFKAAVAFAREIVRQSRIEALKHRQRKQRLLIDRLEREAGG